jgi:hypothetical protein
MRAKRTRAKTIRTTTPRSKSWRTRENSASLEQIREIPILVDNFCGGTHRAYGSLPNMIYLIDRDGIVVYKSDWTDAHEIDGMCACLIRGDEMNTNNVPIIRQGISQRLHRIAMDPLERERIYRRSGEKAIQDYFHARGSRPTPRTPSGIDGEKSHHGAEERRYEGNVGAQHAAPADYGRKFCARHIV